MWRVAVPVILVTASVSLFLGLILAEVSMRDVQDTFQDLQDGIKVFLQPQTGKNEEETIQEIQTDLVDRLQPHARQDESLGQPDVVPHKVWNAGNSENKEEVDEGVCVNRDVDADCQGWAKDGECETNPTWMISNCPTACGMCGTVGGCQNIFEKCPSWADSGECDNNSVWMFFNCPMSCDKCGEVYNGR